MSLTNSSTFRTLKAHGTTPQAAEGVSPVTPLIDLMLADANLMVHKQSLSALDRIALELDAIKREMEPIRPLHMLNSAASYCSNLVLTYATVNEPEFRNWLDATLLLAEKADEVEASNA